MSDSSWCDITVENADELVSFYDVDWHPNGATHLRANGAT